MIGIVHYDVSRGHSSECTQSRHLCGFVAGIIRNGIMNACKKAGYDTNLAIRELNFLAVQRMSDNTYTLVHNANDRQKDLLSQFGMTESDLDFAAREATQRATGIYNQIHTIGKRSLITESDAEGKEEKGGDKGKAASSHNDPQDKHNQ